MFFHPVSSDSISLPNRVSQKRFLTLICKHIHL
jgi:hypothetical protein